jgi:hypothetical protein
VLEQPVACRAIRYYKLCKELSLRKSFFSANLSLPGVSNPKTGPFRGFFEHFLAKAAKNRPDFAYILGIL